MHTPEVIWNSSPPQLCLSNNEVHIWRVSLDQNDREIQHLAEILSPDESFRARNFYFERDRRRFHISRGVLRILLGKYLSIPSSQIKFQYSSYGKPCLAEAADITSISFNLSHSHELALFAFTLSRQIGIDVEHIRPLPDAELISARTFAENENAVIQGLPPDQRLEIFFKCWTQKEAYIKAIGDGLSRPLKEFEVSLIPGAPPHLVQSSGNPGEGDLWSFHTFYPAVDYTAAVVVEGRDFRFSHFEVGNLVLPDNFPFVE